MVAITEQARNGHVMPVTTGEVTDQRTQAIKGLVQSWTSPDGSTVTQQVSTPSQSHGMVASGVKVNSDLTPGIEHDLDSEFRSALTPEKQEKGIVDAIKNIREDLEAAGVTVSANPRLAGKDLNGADSRFGHDVLENMFSQVRDLAMARIDAVTPSDLDGGTLPSVAAYRAMMNRAA